MPSCKINFELFKKAFKLLIIPDKFLIMGFTNKEMILQNVCKESRFITEVTVPIMESSFTESFFNIEVNNLKGLLTSSGETIIFELLQPLPVLEIILDKSVRKYRIIGFVSKEYTINAPSDYPFRVVDTNNIVSNSIAALGLEFKWVNFIITPQEYQIIANNRQFNSAKTIIKIDELEEYEIYDISKTQYFLKPLSHMAKNVKDPIELIISTSGDLFLSKNYDEITCKLIILNNTI